MTIMVKQPGTAVTPMRVPEVVGEAELAAGRPRRRTKTREALFLSGRKLMASRAKDGFTVDDVVQSAGFAKGSFYNHFPDKEALADEIYRTVRAKEESEIEAVNRSVQEPAARVARAMAVGSYWVPGW